MSYETIIYTYKDINTIVFFIFAIHCICKPHIKLVEIV